MNAQDLRLKLSNEFNRLNHERAKMQQMDQDWQQQKELVLNLNGSVQALQALLNEQEASDKAGLQRANQLAAEEAEKNKASPDA